MADDGRHQLVHVLPALGLCGCGKAGIEGLALKLGDLGVLGGGFAQEAFAVESADQGAGFLPLAVNGRAGGAAFGEEDFTRGATLAFDVRVGRAAAVLLRRDDLEGVLHPADFCVFVGRQRGELRILRRKLALHGAGKNGGIQAGEALSGSKLLSHSGTFDSRIDAAEALTHGALHARGLHQVIPTDRVDIRAHGGQSIHHILPGVVIAAAVPAVVPAVAVPRAADRPADSAADESATPVPPAVVIAVAAINIESGHQAFHKSLQKLRRRPKQEAPDRLLSGVSMKWILNKFSLLFTISSRCVQCCPLL